MKVIDLYLAIERNKNIPKKVVYKYKTYRYCPEYKQYYREEYSDMISLFLEATCEEKVYLIEDTPKEDLINHLVNDCGCVIEYTPKEDKKIEKLENKIDTTFENATYSERMRLTEIINKINEIIDRLNGEDNGNN